METYDLVKLTGTFDSWPASLKNVEIVCKASKSVSVSDFWGGYKVYAFDNVWLGYRDVYVGAVFAAGDSGTKTAGSLAGRQVCAVANASGNYSNYYELASSGSIILYSGEGVKYTHKIQSSNTDYGTCSATRSHEWEFGTVKDSNNTVARAVANDGYVFVGFTGDTDKCKIEGNKCTIRYKEKSDVTITAVFAEIPRLTCVHNNLTSHITTKDGYGEVELPSVVIGFRGHERVGGNNAWFTNPEYGEGERVSDPYNLTENTYVYAQWSGYTVTFDANGGEFSQSAEEPPETTRSITVSAYSYSVVMPTPTRKGYDFEGWYENKDGGDRVGEYNEMADTWSYIPPTNITLYAHWTLKDVTVTFDANGGTGGKTVTQKYGTPLSAPTVKRTGYAFAGWSPGVPATMPAVNTTYTAQWTPITYEILFDNDFSISSYARSASYDTTGGGTLTRGWVTLTVDTNAAYVDTKWGTASNYCFIDAEAGKEHCFACKLSNLVGIAKGSVAVFYVAFNSSKAVIKDGSGNYRRLYNTATPADEYFAKFTPPSNTRYIQLVFRVAGEQGVVGRSCRFSDICVCKNDPYGLTGLPKASRRMTFTYSDAANATFGDCLDSGYTWPSITRTGYIFGGFSTSKGNGGTVYSEASKPIAGGVRLWSHWTAKQTALTFDLNGGSGTAPTGKVATYDADMPAYGASAPTRTGYSFKGIYSQSTGGTKYYNANLTSARKWDKVAATSTLYAQFEPYKAYLSFNLNSGAFPPDWEKPGMAYYGTAFEIKHPSRANHTFSGWTVNNVTNTARRGNSSDATTTPLANNATGVAETWFRNLRDDNGATVYFTASWTRIARSVTMENSSERWSVKVYEKDGGAGAGWSHVTSIDAKKSGSETNPSKTFTVKAGASYMVVAVFEKEEYSFSRTFWVPSILTGAGTTPNPAFARYTGQTPAFDKPALYAVVDVSGNTTGPMQWLVRSTTVTVENSVPDPNPHSGSIFPAFRFSDTESTKVGIAAKNDMSELSFTSWTDISPSSALQPSGGESSPDREIVVSTQENVSMTANYALKMLSVSASVDGKTAAVLPDISAKVTLEGLEDPITNVGYGLSATWSFSGEIDSGYEFDGWYDANGVKVSSSQSYTASVTKNMSLNVRCVATVVFRIETVDNEGSKLLPPQNNVRGLISVDGINVPSGYSVKLTLGKEIAIKAMCGNEKSFFNSWFEGATLETATRIKEGGESFKYAITRKMDILAYFSDRASVSYIAVYMQKGRAIGDYGVITVPTQTGEIEELTAVEYENLSGATPLEETTETAGSKFYRVIGIRRVDVGVEPEDPGDAVTRVLRGIPDKNEARVSNLAKIADTAPFSAVVDSDVAYVVCIGDVSSRQLAVSLVVGGEGGSVHIEGAMSVLEHDEDSRYEKAICEVGSYCAIVATPENGWQFDGWYSSSDGSGEPISDSSTYRMEVVYGSGGLLTVYAKFSRGSFALYEWEGSSANKVLTWKSKVYELSKPANLTSVRVDTQHYPVFRFKSESFSAPDAEPTRSVDFATGKARLASQTMRRLPQRRPERYFQVEVQNDAEIDAITIGTSGEGLAT